jgi:catalase
MDVPKGQVAFEPSSLPPRGPRELPGGGFTTFASSEGGEKVRLRPETFADHYSQARLFFRSMSEPEQRHIVSAFAFELGKVETVEIRRRMLGHLDVIDPALGNGVAAALGMEGQALTIKPARAPLDLPPSPALSLVQKAPKTLEGRKVAVLVTDGSDPALVQALRAAVEKEGARLAVVAPKIGGVKGAGGKAIAADHALSAAPSVLFDAVVVAASKEGTALLATQAAAVDWVRDAFGHLKVIGHVAAARALLDKAGVESDAGVVEVSTPKAFAAFVAAAKKQRIWDREPKARAS